MASDKLTKAIYLDKIIKPAKQQICLMCKEQARCYHHHSYTEENALNVIPVCYKCHGYIHSKRSIFHYSEYKPELFMWSIVNLYASPSIAPEPIKSGSS